MRKVTVSFDASFMENQEIKNTLENLAERIGRGQFDDADVLVLKDGDGNRIGTASIGGEDEG